MKLSCMVVDDDPISIKVVKHFAENTNFLDLKFECSNAIEASNKLREEDIDVVFLDVKMPEMSGMELLRVLEGDYEIILVTSEKEHALEAIEYDVTDYLLKPIEYGRFLKAANKAKTNIEKARRFNQTQKDIYVKSDSKIVKIGLGDILFVEALADYVIINTPDKKHIVHSTMKGIEKKLPDANFIRVHRSYIVNTDKILSLEDLTIKISDKSIPIGASYKANFMDKLNFL